MRTLMGATRVTQCSSSMSSTPTAPGERRSRSLCTGSLYNAPSFGTTNPAALLPRRSLSNARVLSLRLYWWRLYNRTGADVLCGTVT